VHCEPWLILPSAHATIVALLESRLNGEAANTDAEAFGGLIDRMAAARPKMSVANGIAEIPINGTIGRGLGRMEKACGGVSVEDVTGDIAEALGRRDVSGLLLNIDSPGGTTTGVPELGEAIARAGGQKPVVAFTDGMMASAAYWAGSQTDLIIASKSANVGSIGVYIPWTDQTKQAEMRGLKVEAIKNKEGSYKAMGLPGTALTDAQREHLQARADEIFSMFKGDILARRPGVAAEAMRGQTLLAAAARESGLIDDIGDLAHARASLQAIIKMRG
jgi:signal peptide peptidase SppA